MRFLSRLPRYRSGRLPVFRQFSIPVHVEEEKHDNPEVQQLWDQISQARNLYAHAGFKQNERLSDEKIETWLQTVYSEIDNDKFWQETN